MSNLERVRPSPIAGRWYPANPDQLTTSVDRSLTAARLAPMTQPALAVLAPHAGHVYSGDVAGMAFAAVQGRAIDLVALVGPLHYPFPYSLTTTLHQAYATPLGEVPVDREAVAALESALQQRGHTLTGIAQDPEHALEIELPFLQRALLGSFAILPVMVRSEDAQLCRDLGECLAGVLRGRSALLVASSDLSHYRPAARARLMDEAILQPVTALDPQGLLLVQAEERGYACGVGALASVIWAAKALGAQHASILRYATSGDVTGDHDRVVGYAAAVLW